MTLRCVGTQEAAALAGLGLLWFEGFFCQLLSAVSCCRGNPICQPVSLSRLPLSPCEDDAGLRFLFLSLQLHPATVQDVGQAGGTPPELAVGRKCVLASCSLWFCEGACLMEQRVKVTVVMARSVLASDWL